MSRSPGPVQLAGQAMTPTAPPPPAVRAVPIVPTVRVMRGTRGMPATWAGALSCA